MISSGCHCRALLNSLLTVFCFCADLKVVYAAYFTKTVPDGRTIVHDENGFPQTLLSSSTRISGKLRMGSRSY